MIQKLSACGYLRRSGWSELDQLRLRTSSVCPVGQIGSVQDGSDATHLHPYKQVKERNNITELRKFEFDINYDSRSKSREVMMKIY